ncbi:MAG: NADP-dependent isocitrate dehydrogenase [Planctomycetota bacterium]
MKEYARKNPHRMGKWEASSPSHVASMESGDFFGNERSVTVDAPLRSTSSGAAKTVRARY